MGCKDVQNKDRRNFWWVGMFCAILLATYLAKVWNPYWGWFIGGVLINFSIQMVYPSKRPLVKKVGMVIFGGVVCSAIYYFVNSIGI